MSPDVTDGALVRRTRDGDMEAYGILVTRYQGHVYGLAYSLCGNWEEAQDIAQETFLRAYCNLEQLREPERFAAWLRRVTFGVAMNWLRAHRPRRFEQFDGRVDLDALEIPDFAPGPPEVLARKELAEAVQRAIDSLPARYRLPLTMFHLDGLSYEKVADFLDIPLGTAKSLISRARAKLREALAPYVMEEVLPMVQEVFNEHRLPDEFARRVLTQIPRVGKWPFQSTSAPEDHSFAACLRGFLQSVEDDLYEWTRPFEPDWHGVHDYVMGASGIAFQMTWAPNWLREDEGCWDLFNMALDPLEPIRRTFAAIGYGYEVLLRRDLAHSLGLNTGTDDEAAFRHRLLESIGRGRPVLAFGPMGHPTEWSLVTGYDESGTVLVGWPFYHEGEEATYAGEADASGYFRRRDWFARTRAMVFLGEKEARPPKREAYRQILEWALRVMFTPEVRGKASGHAAYRAWIAALSQDDFESLSAEELQHRQGVHSVTWGHIAESRAWGARFLDQAAAADPAWNEEITAAVHCFDAQHKSFYAAGEAVNHLDDRTLANPEYRRIQSEFVVRCLEQDERAAAHIARALAM